MENRRSYKQFCGLARALDRVGERWTLLVVRNLLLGPRRYTDLLEELPGLTTNLLAELNVDERAFELAFTPARLVVTEAPAARPDVRVSGHWPDVRAWLFGGV